jgi:hypothetical protein
MISKKTSERNVIIISLSNIPNPKSLIGIYKNYRFYKKKV